MKTFSDTSKQVSWLLYLATSQLLAVASAADKPAQPPLSEAPASCELIFEGPFANGIEKLILDSNREPVSHETVVLDHPGSKAVLPAGKYEIVEIRLQEGLRTRASDQRETLVLTPEEPCRLAVLAPLTPRVTVKRSGRLLVLDCQVCDVDGKKATSVRGRVPPPQFTVYQGDREIGSGTFEYG
jgi:hypothetical protein